MNEEIKKYYSVENDGLGEAQVYKTVKFYPLKLVDIYYYNLFYRLFTYPKVAVDRQNPKVYKISYFQFILAYIQAMYDPEQKDIVLHEDLVEFFKFVTKQQVKIVPMHIIDDKYSLQLHIGNIVFDEQDFNNIREMILQQNGLSIEYCEEYNPDLEIYLNFSNRNSEKYDFNDQLIFFAVKMQKTIEELKDKVTIYQMKNMIKIFQDITQHERHIIDLTNISSKDYKIPSTLEHLSVPGKYDSILEDVDDVKAKTSFDVTE